jgi:thiamine pyrophosphate-dependent acetolactate synthase large subunit-like protein
MGFTIFVLGGGSASPHGRRQQNFYMLGSMGLAVPIALGVAIAQPTRKVFALEGDGSVLMQLGSLSTVAARAQKNLCIVIMDNGAYQITGGQVTMTAQGTDIVGIARASGLTQSAWAADEDAFVELIGRALKEDGPWLIGCRIDNQKPVDTTERDPSRIRDNFMRGLGVRA